MSNGPVSGGPPPDYEINPASYEWTARLMSIMESRLGVKIKLHRHDRSLEAGQIFLFNHFARFETFIPQYLIYKETGVACRSIAAAELFEGNDTFANYLISVGGIPHNHPRILPFLAEEILRGRKVIIFPEGGMVKDRRVIDRKGQFHIYSRTAHERRKHHIGAAVLALTLECFKRGIVRVHEDGDRQTLERWAGTLHMESVEALVAAAEKPTLVAPSNITFYPIRVTENALQKGVELFSKGISKRLYEELLIEGNLLLKDTDMDLRLGSPIDPGKAWRWWHDTLFAHLARTFEDLDSFFNLNQASEGMRQFLSAQILRKRTFVLRDAYMEGMYRGVTLNLSHLASRILVDLAGRDRMEIDCCLFHKTLYVAVRYARSEPSIHLHRSLKNPDYFINLVDGRCEGLDQFMNSKAIEGLVEKRPYRYHILPKLCEESRFDEIRLENLVMVYANEMAPIRAARDAVEKALAETPSIDAQTFAEMRFEDEIASHAWHAKHFSKPKFAAINDQETATESAEPFFLLPEGEKAKKTGVVLVHGFLASPAEMRPFADRLCAAGYPVMGVRLNGHGTSPWDLRKRSWRNWMEPIGRGCRILSAFSERVCLVGFSSGGALSLLLAAEGVSNLAGVCAISAPLKFRNKNLVFIPLLHGLNKVVRWLPSMEGVMPFRANASEHPHINYRNVAIRGLYELRLMAEELDDRLKDVHCPTTIIQGTDDHVVDPESAELIISKLGSPNKELHWIETERHGVLYDDIGDTREITMAFLDSLSG